MSQSSNRLFSFTALPGGKSVYIERWPRYAAASGGWLSLLEEPSWIYGAPKRRIEHDDSTWLNADGHLGFVIDDGGGIRVDGGTVSLNTPPGRDTIIVTLPNATAADTKALVSPGFRRTTDHRDVAAAFINGLLVCTNLGPHSAAVSVEHGGRKIPLAIRECCG